MKENDAHELTQGTNRSILRILSEPPFENIVKWFQIAKHLGHFDSNVNREIIEKSRDKLDR